MKRLDFRNFKPKTLKVLLLCWLIPALVFIMLVALWIFNHQLRDQADAAYDRSLLGALRSIDHNISTASGGLALEQPYLMLEFFELTTNGDVYYRVATEDGLAEIGSQDLPLPTKELVSGQVQFFNAPYQGGWIRVAALARPMDPPLYNDKGGRVIIQVAENLAAREQFIQQVMVLSIERDLSVIIISIVLVVVSVFMAARPLGRLRREVEARSTDDLSPVSASEVPGEVLPLITAVNLHMARFTRQAGLQRQFLDDASHQLRTPLSVLRTQVAYALREKDPQEVRTVLVAMQNGLDRAVRTTNQMLALARAKHVSLEGGGLTLESIDMVELADSVVRTLFPSARVRQLDLGLETQNDIAEIQGVEWLLREALSNLVDNAIRYSPLGGEVTVKVTHMENEVHVIVEDSGPGMSEQDIAQAGVRFRRGTAGKNTSGAGLGLAIVGTIAEIHSGKVIFETRANQSGLRASLVFSLGFHQIDAMHHEIKRN